MLGVVQEKCPDFNRNILLQVVAVFTDMTWGPYSSNKLVIQQ